ncbi:DISP complex protein LRCH3 isoform X8 [Lepisosteus oculatus]|uniref:DISP complex protein LRCH3 isoform X8 n=1 Tax=Lepisosteus oculatus TaxID=7918 RepID=UPI00074040BF|nr:PREDICTED: leucine-rich repeat and calponin homology domain-containing protein 3 isoform X8 [Lepisosteus oculatus]
MAAAVLLSAEGPGPGVPGVPGSGPGVAGPASWNRSLDRALEEAAVTGFLNLSGRKLKEFPRSAANHDLTDTTQADLSRNRLSELPVEVCLFVSLESLNLYQNCIRTLPETMLNLQALTYLNISRNQLSTLPALVCGLPLKVLIACNNKLVSLPEEIGQLRQLTELDVSCNEIQMLPSQMGQLESLRDLNIRRNHLARLPPELAELPLVRLDFSCNKVTTIPVCYRNLRHLQSIVLDNNPLQSPPAQICIKGKIHIFKYLNMEACKNVADLPDFDRRPLGFGSCMEDLYPGRLYGALDSGFNSVDSGDKRWSGNEPTDELTDLPLRVAEITKEQRQRREREREESRTGALVSNGTVEAELEQIDFIDSCAGEDEEEESRHRGAEPASLSSQFMAYIERRITREGSPVKSSPTRDPLRTDDPRRHPILHSRSLVDSGSTSPSIAQSQRMSGGVERVRREAQIAALQYEEERQRTRHLQRDAMLSYVKHKAVQSPSKQSPTDSESEDRSTLSPSSSLPPSALQSPSYPGSAAPPPFRGPALRPDSFLFRLSKREESRRAAGSAAIRPESGGVSPPSSAAQGEEAELVEQLRKSIESRLKVSLPSDLGAALTDGVVLCHLANHVRPRSVPSIHVPSPAVPKLTMAKCRRNVENFLEACRRIGVPQEQLCSVGAVLGGEGGYVYHTLEALLSLSTPPSAAPPGQLACFALFYLSVMSLLCALYCHLVPRF